MALTLHTLSSSKGSKTKTKRVGRGQSSGRGKTAGRGTKGQRARTGGKKKLKLKGMKQMILGFPKNRGFRSRFAEAATVPLSRLKVFGAGEKVDLDLLKKHGLVKRSDRRAKVVSGGELTKKLTLIGIQTSVSAKAAIEKAGGTLELHPSTKGKKGKREEKGKALKKGKK